MAYRVLLDTTSFRTIIVVLETIRVVDKKAKRQAKRERELREQILNNLKLKKIEKGWLILDLSVHPKVVWGPYLSRVEAEKDRQCLATAFTTIKQDETRHHDK